MLAEGTVADAAVMAAAATVAKAEDSEAMVHLHSSTALAGTHISHQHRIYAMRSLQYRNYTCRSSKHCRADRY